jgi:hypothetical protein
MAEQGETAQSASVGKPRVALFCVGAFGVVIAAALGIAARFVGKLGGEGNGEPVLLSLGMTMLVVGVLWLLFGGSLIVNGFRRVTRPGGWGVVLVCLVVAMVVVGVGAEIGCVAFGHGADGVIQLIVGVLSGVAAGVFVRPMKVALGARG